MSLAKPIDDEEKYKSLLGDSITSDDPLVTELDLKVYDLGIYF